MCVRENHRSWLDLLLHTSADRALRSVGNLQETEAANRLPLAQFLRRWLAEAKYVDRFVNHKKKEFAHEEVMNEECVVVSTNAAEGLFGRLEAFARERRLRRIPLKAYRHLLGEQDSARILQGQPSKHGKKRRHAVCHMMVRAVSKARCHLRAPWLRSTQPHDSCRRGLSGRHQERAAQQTKTLARDRFEAKRSSFLSE